jgi:hypothetical protein
MTVKVEDTEDPARFRLLTEIPYTDLISFILDHLRKKSVLIAAYWSGCILFLAIAVTVRANIAGYFPLSEIIMHSVIGLIVFPIISIPVHEFLHIIPFYLSGARNIRIGMDLSQLIFYVTAHRYVAGRIQFIIVALTPFLLISSVIFTLIFLIPGLWKWSLSLFLFIHTTMCAGDFALLNYYWLNRNKKIFTWDDADKKIAYFYEKL